MNSASIAVTKIKAEKSAKAKKNISKVLIPKLSVALLIVLIVVASAWKIKLNTNGKILPKIMIAGIQVGGKTQDEAKRLVLGYINTINKTGPTINYEDKSINSTLPELGVSFDVDKVVTNAYNYGRTGSIKNKLIQNTRIIFTHNSISLNPTIDENKLDEFLTKINQTVSKPAENANLSINNGQISLISEKKGLGFDKDILKNNLRHAINNDIHEKISLAITVLEPKIYSKNTIEASNQAEKLMQSAPINLIYQDRTYVISKTDIGTWIEFKENNNTLNADLSSQKVSAYANKIASKVIVKKIDREIVEGTGEVLVEGQDGIGVDTGKLNQNIFAQVTANNKNSIAIGTYPIPKSEITKNPHALAGRYPGKYIDVNLSEQTLYAFEGTTLVKQFLISSGIAGHSTPTGEYSVYGKTRAQTMDGPGYSLPNVEWISWWNGDYSIHGTYWHHNFGHPMSHGCVNASNADAEWLYNWDSIGTPVYTHW